MSYVTPGQPIRTRRLATRVAGITLAAFGLALGGCASAPPPTEAMTHWQVERDEPHAPAVVESQPSVVAKADAAFARAEQAHAEGEIAARNHNLRLADIHWRTAVARSHAARETDELAVAQAKIADRERTLAEIEAGADTLRKGIAADRGPAVTTGERVMPTTLRGKAEYTLDTAVVDLSRADGVAAETRAPLLYTKAGLAYDEAARHYAAGRYEQAVDRSTDASKLARDAYEEALPKHRQDTLQADLEARRDALLSRLLRVGTPVVSEDDISISLINYFPEDGDDVRASKRATLEALAGIIRAFPEYSVKLVGHTSSAGHPTDNLMLSQARALAVRKVLEDEGVEGDRLTSVGHGESHALELARGYVVNARIDVVFEPLDVEVVQTRVGDAR